LGSVLAIVSLVTVQAAPDNDPNLWLSDIHGAKALDWVKAQDAKSNAVLKNDPRYPKDYDALLAALNTNDRVPLGTLDHGDVYDFWQDGKHERGIWRRASVAEYGKASPNWELLLDVDKLDADEKTPFVFQNADCAPGGKRCIITLSPGGSDATTVREFDLKTKTFLKDGFSLSLSKLNEAYIDVDTVLFDTDFGPGTMTTSSYPRIMKVWRRGEPISAAKTVFEAKTNDVAVRPLVFHGPFGNLALIDHALSFFESEFYALKKDGVALRLPLPLGANIQGVTDDDLIFLVRDAWTAPGEKGPFTAGSLVAFSLDFLDGKPAHYAVLATPDPRSTIDSVAAGRDAVYASIFTDVTGAVHEFRKGADGRWSDATLAMPKGGSTTVVTADSWTPAVQLTFESFLTPPTLFAYDGGGAPTAVRAQRPVFDASNLVSDQHWATSKDGTKIPYFLVHAKGVKGPVPTILYSYGGFEISLTPWYWNDGHRPLYPGVPWFSRGGAIAVANIRGGSEFGPKWHEAALKFHHQNPFDDFQAVAEDLLRSHATTTAQLGIVGASNGGLLVSASMTERPDLFHAVVCQRPLIDMLRYTQFGAGQSWTAEYGDPADPKMRAYIAKYSPYQNVKTGVSYPHALFITETSDDRVTPIWARMMAAKMEAQGHDVLFNEALEGGHGPGATNSAQAEMWALSYVYLARELGLK
jgi:prolyl oligopeptidase